MTTLTAWAEVNDPTTEAATGGPTNAAGGWGAPVPLPVARSHVHGPIRPADVRPGDPVFARVRRSGARREKDVELQVWRVSPLAVELVWPTSLGAARPGTAIDLDVQIGRDLVAFRGLPIAEVREERGRTVVAARWTDAEERRGDRERRRIGARWRTTAEYRGTGIARSPVGYNDWVHFRIVEISRDGMQLHTSLRNKYLVPGTTFRAACSFPTQPQVELDFEVVQGRVVEDAGKEVLCLGVTWRARAARAREVVAQYVLQFTPGATPKRLRTEGFRVKSAARVFDIGSVRDEEDYREVLALRRAAYVAAGKASPDATDAKMGDALDVRSRIITARWNGRLVGSLRLTFPRVDADRLHHEDDCELPGTLPPRSEIVEASKACTDPEFRGADLFYALLKQAALVVVQARRRYILMSCTDDLHRVYRALGFQDVGAAYVHPASGVRVRVLIGDAASMIAGGMNPIAWNVAVGPELYHYAKLCGVFPKSAWMDVRIRLVRLLKPLAFLAYRSARRGGARA